MISCYNTHLLYSVTQLCLTDSTTPWTVAQQAPLSTEFFSKEYWSGLPFSPPGDLPIPGIKPTSPAFPVLQVESLLLSYWGSSIIHICVYKYKHRKVVWKKRHYNVNRLPLGIMDVWAFGLYFLLFLIINVLSLYNKNKYKNKIMPHLHVI